MATTTQHSVRLSERTHVYLIELSELTGESMSALVAKAVRQYYPDRINEIANDQWRKLMEDPEAAREMAEIDAELDALVNEGLEDEPW